MKIKDSIPPSHSEGYIFVIIAAAFSFLSGAVFPTLGWIAAMITIFIACFFRDPKRISPEGDNLIISPADGTIHKIEEANAPEELELGKKTYLRISIFLSVFNVHVNRVPIAGKITQLHYRNGKFFNAALDKASVDNERQSCVVETKQGKEVIFVQIAGLIAKRIICDLKEDQEVASGEKFGIIRFGSRMDVYLPKDTKINVLPGQTMIGGETILAQLSEAKKAAPKTAPKKAPATKKPAVKKK